MNRTPKLTILLGIAGGVSAYKSCDLLRRLQESPDFTADITVLPTQSSLHFVGTSLWEALSGNPVYTDMWDQVQNVPHISLAKNADLIIIAPTTADTLARLAHGRADDLLTATVIASTAPKILVPAMHPEMYLNPLVQANIATLRTAGYIVVDPDEGRMTGEDVGVGRYPETKKILSTIREALHLASDLKGRKILISAGGTREAIDPIRYIGNRSSGKQGFEIASAAASRGADVTVVAANVDLPHPRGVRVISIESAREMQEALQREFSSHDALFMAAAVADVRPATTSTSKISKDGLNSLELVENPDIVASLSQMRRDGQVICAFAAQTGDEGEDLAREKLLKKKVDFIYFNDVSHGAIFGEDETEGLLLQADGERVSFLKQSKAQLAHKLLDIVVNKLSFSHD